MRIHAIMEIFHKNMKSSNTLMEEHEHNSEVIIALNWSRKISRKSKLGKARMFCINEQYNFSLRANCYEIVSDLYTIIKML